ncbi:MAG TPA: DHA2 family efflux MFS transporter permease subunit, partial [Chloroflexota bacterium]|nr:DHA2 family efflux MFS transporter permease subunit [Chloroflexota bacterium]
TLSDRQLALATILVGTGAVMSSLSNSSLNVAFPELTATFGVAPATIAWVSLAYSLITASTLTIFGRVADMRGRKGLYALGVVLFLTGSALCGISRSVSALIAWRVVQGAGGALVLANSVAYLVEIYPPNRRGFVVGTWEACIAIGQGVGPVVGGLLLSLFGWPAIFYANLPLGLAMLVMIPRFMIEPPRVRSRQRFDFLGAALFGTGIAALMYAMTQSYALGWNSAPVVGSLLAAAVCAVLFVVTEQRVSQPMVDLGMFRSPTFSAGNLAKVFGYFPYAANGFLMPFYLERGLGLAPATIGASLTPLPIGMLASSLIAGTLSDRIGTRVLAPAGLAIQALACLWLTQVSPEQGAAPALLAMLLAGIGIGTFIAPNDSAILSATAPEKLGVANGIMGVARTLGLLLGVSAPAGLLSARLAASSNAFLPSFHQVYWMVFAVTCAGIWLAAVRDRRPPSGEADPSLRSA